VVEQVAGFQLRVKPVTAATRINGEKTMA